MLCSRVQHRLGCKRKNRSLQLQFVLRASLWLPSALPAANADGSFDYMHRLFWRKRTKECLKKGMRKVTDEALPPGLAEVLLVCSLKVKSWTDFQGSSSEENTNLWQRREAPGGVSGRLRSGLCRAVTHNYFHTGLMSHFIFLWFTLKAKSEWKMQTSKSTFSVVTDSCQLLKKQSGQFGVRY